MCLTIDFEATDKFLKDHDPNEEIVVWKVYACFDDDNGIRKVQPIYRRSTGKIKPGIVKSNRTNKAYDSLDTPISVNRGIHVFRTRKDARRFLDDWYPGNVFRCTAKVDDLVAIGGRDDVEKNQAVFMKICISKSNFEKGKKGRA